MGNLSLFSKIRGIGRDSRKERAMVPVTSALEIELTDEELATIRGGHHHHHHHHHWHDDDYNRGYYYNSYGYDDD